MAEIQERFGDPRDMSMDEVLDYCMAVTNKSPEEHEQPTAVCACASDKASRMIYRKKKK